MGAGNEIRVRARVKILLATALAACLAAPAALSAQALTPALTTRFDRGDRESRALLATLRCAQSVGNFRANGVFGPIDSLGRIGQCMAVEGKWVGIFFDADSQFTRVTRFSAVDFVTRARRTAPLDTSAVLAVGRAEFSAQLQGIKSYEEAHRPYSPFAFRFDGDSIEVWMIPEAVLRGQPVSVGGERGYLFTPEGRTVVRQVDDFAELRTITVPDTGTVAFTSHGHDVPTLTEFMLANALNARGRTVSIATPWGQSVLVGQGPAAQWLQLTH